MTHYFPKWTQALTFQKLAETHYSDFALMSNPPCSHFQVWLTECQVQFSVKSPDLWFGQSLMHKQQPNRRFRWNSEVHCRQTAVARLLSGDEPQWECPNSCTGSGEWSLRWWSWWCLHCRHHVSLLCNQGVCWITTRSTVSEFIQWVSN